MCFETTKTARAKIAKTDIKCWKYLDAGNYSPCYGLFRYEKGKPCSDVELNIIETCESDTGHGITAGYHSYKTKNSAPYWLRSDTFVKRFIIPVGTRYYENKTEYVSETIILKS